MKVITALFILLSVQLGYTQELKTHKLLPPSTVSIDDLSFLKDELEGKQLLMLGEQTHQYGTIFEMKTRVVEYLHQELGFTTFAMESSMYDIWKMNKKGSFNSVDFNQAIYGVWSSAEEFQRLVNYIDKHKLKVIGFDSQISNNGQFIDDFFDYCEDYNIKIKLDEEDMAIVMEGVLGDYFFEEYDIKFSDYEKELKRIIKKINTFKDNDLHYHWKQFTKSVLATSRDAYKNTEEIESYNFINEQHNIRDAQMADNILSYIERNPTEKIMLWADNIHIINNLESLKEPILNKFVSMGSHIKNTLGDKAYSLATLHANDSISYQKKWSKTPILKNSFEDELRALDIPYLFVSSNQKAMKTSKKHRLLSYLDFFESQLDELHDGYIFARYAEDSNPYIIKDVEVTEFKETLIDTVKNNKATVKENNETKYLTGKIVDIETNEPVAYANLILKKEEIYRISDENGNFKIPVTKELLVNASVNISSIGYTSENIRLNQLNEIIKLSPSLESLDEVVLIAHTTPLTVLKKAVKRIKLNHPTTPFNYDKYTKVLFNQNDEDILDIDLLTKEYDLGYRQLYRAHLRVDQIKWNKNTFGKRLNNTDNLFSLRQNALRYSNIVHRRKYKKFDLEFVKSKDPKDEDVYIIAFKTQRNKWNYTNRGYPTSYSGKIYINRDDFAIVKIAENWETTLNIDEIKRHNYYSFDLKSNRKLKEVKIKEEKICKYTKYKDEKYYGNNFFSRSYVEYTLDNEEHTNIIKQFDSSLFNLDIENVEVIDYDFHHQNEMLLRRVDYDKTFWASFNNDLYLKFIKD